MQIASCFKEHDNYDNEKKNMGVVPWNFALVRGKVSSQVPSNSEFRFSVERDTNIMRRCHLSLPTGTMKRSIYLISPPFQEVHFLQTLDIKRSCILASRLSFTKDLEIGSYLELKL
ncbi:hypothetical protein VTP01DRAFT_7649, partial [Rhizomucor pusillus]|uniref:uncharacterized protein n=1 Tax=Rhizomucor pusillus TaxID=4840 RepID=UPI00374282C4